MRKALVLVLGTALLTTSCYTLSYSNSTASKPISFTGEVKGQSTHFTEEKWIWYALWGLIPISDNDIVKSLIEPRTPGGAVQNLSITSQTGAQNVLANIFTCLISICSRTITIEGEVVR